MAQGEFTKQAVVACRTALEEIMEAMSKRKVPEYIGHFNDLFLFLDAAEKKAPNEKTGRKKGKKR